MQHTCRNCPVSLGRNWNFRQRSCTMQLNFNLTPKPQNSSVKMKTKKTTPNSPNEVRERPVDISQLNPNSCVPKPPQLFPRKSHVFQIPVTSFPEKIRFPTSSVPPPDWWRSDGAQAGDKSSRPSPSLQKFNNLASNKSDEVRKLRKVVNVN